MYVLAGDAPALRRGTKSGAIFRHCHCEEASASVAIFPCKFLTFLEIRYGQIATLISFARNDRYDTAAARNDKIDNSLRSIRFCAQCGNFGKACGNFFGAIRTVGEQTAGTILDAAFGIGKAAAAVFAQSVKRAVAEQAVKAFIVCTAVAGEVCTVPILKKRCTVFHIAVPIFSPRRTLVSMPCAL